MHNKIEQLKKICKGVDYEIFQDDVLIANASTGAQHYGISLNECAPTFILKAEDDFVALIIQGSKRVDFKKVRQVSWG